MEIYELLWINIIILLLYQIRSIEITVNNSSEDSINNYKYRIKYHNVRRYLLIKQGKMHRLWQPHITYYIYSIQNSLI